MREQNGKDGEYNRESAGDSDRYCSISDSNRGVR